MSDVAKLLKELRADIKKDSEESLQRLEDRLTAKIDEKFDSVQFDINKIKEINLNYEKRINNIEKQHRERNLIFFGINEGEKSYDSLEWKIINTIKNETNIECDKTELQMVRRMGKFDENKVRPIVVTFTTYGRKISLLKNKKNMKSETIYIKEDFPPHVLEIRKNLQEQLQQEKAAGKIAHLRYNKLIIREPTEKNENQTRDKKERNKKRILEITPPHRNENPNRELTQRALKKNKINASKPGTSQSSMDRFVSKPNSYTQISPEAEENIPSE